MASAAFIAGDWGTSHARLFLCAPDGAVLDARNGPGVRSTQGDVAGAFFSMIEPWDEEYGPLPAILCGMVGSTIGWREVPYVDCPAPVAAIARAATAFAANGRRIAIAPGLSCRNKLGAPDMMRGEETQILGALAGDPGLAAGWHLLCLPGTHTKWVSLGNGSIEHFLTALSGELFDMLHKHSVLAGAGGAPDGVGGPEFARALEQTKIFPDADLLHLLFQTRSRQLKGELKLQDAAAFLSGLVVGRDVGGAKRLLRDETKKAGRVTVIGSPKLAELYVQALGAHEIPASALDGDVVARAGLKSLYEIIFSRDAIHAA